MQMGFSLFGNQDQDDIDSGTRILEAYFEEARIYPDFPYQDLDSFIAGMNQKLGGGENFAKNVGEIVRLNYASTTESDASQRVTMLADNMKGAASPTQIIMASAGTGNTVNWAAGLPEVATQTGVDIAQTAVNAAEGAGQVVVAAGEGLLATGKTLKYLPWILAGAGVLALLFYGQPILKMMSKK